MLKSSMLESQGRQAQQEYGEVFTVAGYSNSVYGKRQMTQIEAGIYCQNLPVCMLTTVSSENDFPGHVFSFRDSQPGRQ